MYLVIRGEETLEELSENLTLTDLGAESQQNLSCAGVNLVGEGDHDAIELLVYGGIMQNTTFKVNSSFQLPRHL